MSKIRLRTKPSKPKRKKPFVKQLCDCDESSLKHLVEIAEVQGIPPESVYVCVETEYDHCDQYYIAYLVARLDEEPEEMYNNRLAEYEQKLAAWEQWYEKHKDAVEAEKKRREQERKEKEAKAAEKAAEAERKLFEKLKKKFESNPL